MNNVIAFNSRANMTMTSREIAELTGKEHKHVIRDIRTMLDVLEKDGPKLDHPQEDKDARGYTTCIYLNRELTETLLTGYSASARLKVIRRWHELEEQVVTPTVLLPNFNDPAIAARAWADEVEQKQAALVQAQQATEQLAIAAPKAEALDRIAAGDENVTLTQAAKILSIKRDTLTQWLHANGWVYRQNGSWVAYDAQIRTGRLAYKEAKYTDDTTGQEVHRPYCHITPKGLTWLAENGPISLAA